MQARLREGDPAYLDAVVKEVLRTRPALTIAPRLLLEPVEIAGLSCPPACRWPRVCGWPAARGFVDGRVAVPPGTMARRQPPPNPLSWIPFGGGVRRCAGAPFAEMEMREVLRAASGLTLRPAHADVERARRSMLVLVPHRGAEVLVG